MTNTPGNSPELYPDSIKSHRLTIQRRFLPFAIKPARYLALQWPEYSHCDSECESVSLLVGANYEKRANDPFIAAIAEAVSGARTFEIGHCFAFPAEAFDALRRVGASPFAAPQLSALSDSALLVVALDQIHELTEVSRLLEAANISLDARSRKESGAPALVAVVENEIRVDLFATIFDRVYRLTDFEAAFAESKTITEVLQFENSEAEFENDSCRLFYPQQPVTPLTEVSYERARVAFRSQAIAGVDVSKLGLELGGALQRSGQTEYQLERCNELAGLLDLGDLCAALNLHLPNSIIGATLTEVSPSQINARLLESLNRYRRARIELVRPTLSASCCGYIGEKHAAIDSALQALYSSPDIHCKLALTVGYPIDGELEVSETVEALCALARVIDRRRGLKVRFVRYLPQPDSLRSIDAQLSVDEIEERYKRIITCKKLKGISFSLADQFPELFSLALNRGMWSDAFSIAEFCARRSDEPQSRWLDLLNTERGLDLALGAQIEAEGLHSKKIAKSVLESVSDRIELDVIEETQSAPRSSAFGRSGKRSARQTVAAPTMGRVRFTWSKTGAARFLSHLDNLRTIEAALLRAKLHVAYTQGQKPRMKLSFGPPLPVGFSSESELFDVFFETAPLAEELVATLNNALPGEFRINAAESVYTKAPSALEEVKAAEYLVALEGKSEGEVTETLERVIGSESLPFVRKRKSRERELNLRAGLYCAEVAQSPECFAGLLASDSVIIKISLALTDTFYVRPEEFLIACGLLDIESAPGVLVHRSKLQTATQRALPVLTTESK